MILMLKTEKLVQYNVDYNKRGFISLSFFVIRGDENMAQQSYLDEFLTLMRTEGTNVIINDQNLRMIRYSVIE